MSEKNGFFKECECCKTQFYVQQYRAAQAKFCSRKCSWNSKISPGRSGAWLACTFCGKRSFIVTNRFKKFRYCSRKCSSIATFHLREPARLKAIRGKSAHNRIDLELKRARKYFIDHRHRSKIRKIGFKFTFEEWFKFWKDSGHWYERGRCKGQYVMARFNDEGAYEAGNVRICTSDVNLKERKKMHAPNRRLSDDDIRRIRSLDGKMKRKLIAEEYGINYWHIRDIQKRRVSEHVK